MEFGIENGGMRMMRNRKRQIIERIELPKSRKNQKFRRKGNLQVLRNIESEYHQTNGNDRKNFKKSISGECRNFSKPNVIKGINT